MGLRGIPPTPTKILEARGSWHAKTRTGEPQPEPGKPACPRHLTEPQRKLWRQLCQMLEEMKVLTKVDGSQLERYCIYFVRWRECEAFIAANGISYPVKSDDPGNYVGKLPGQDTAVVGFQEYPQVRESHRLHAALKQIEQQFGLTPSARTRLQAIASEADADSISGFVRLRATDAS